MVYYFVYIVCSLFVCMDLGRELLSVYVYVYSFVYVVYVVYCLSVMCLLYGPGERTI